MNEAVEVWTPVTARSTGGGIFEILGPMPADESWQFAPHSFVRCETHKFADGTIGLVAVELAPQATHNRF